MQTQRWHPLVRYGVKRLLTLGFVLLGVTFLTYGLMYLSPSDPVEMLLQAQGVPVSPEVVEAMKAESGLNRPFLVQYAAWLGRLLQGDFGVSLMDGTSVAGLLAGALPKTLLLAGSALLLTVLISVPLGVLCAVRQNRAVDYVLRGAGFVANAVPNFLLSLLLIYFIALKLGWLNVVAAGGLSGLIMPTLALALPLSGRHIRQVRAAVLEQIGKPHVAGAAARGVRGGVILRAAVLRNALPTIVTVFSLSAGGLLGGTAAIERIFSWRGVGYVLMDAIMMRDYPVIQGFVVWTAAAYVAINLVADVLCLALDPRMRMGLEVGR